MQEQQQNIVLSDEIKQKIDEWIKRYPEDRKLSAIIPALHIAQDANKGWLSLELINAVADYLEIPHISAYEVAKFYSMFELSPVGKHKVNLCTNISCQLAGSGKIADYLRKKLGVEFGETTADGKFTLKEVECLGACVNAPMMQLDKTYHEHLTEEHIDEILDGLE